MAQRVRKAWQKIALSLLLASALIAPAQGADAAELGQQGGCYNYGVIDWGWDKWYYAYDYWDPVYGHVFVHYHYDWWGQRYLHDDYSIYC